MAQALESTSPAALVIPPSQYFEGVDGPWSTFDLRVGTREQYVRVLVSTASPETLVVLSEYGCSTQVFSQDLGIFSINDGEVGLEANLDYVQRAQFGLDTLGIGLVPGASGPTLENQTIAGFATAAPFYLGTFGLNNQPVNFTTLGNFSSPSYLVSLKAANLIPSLSWSYTAGAYYRLKKVYGQLIFSGYDTSRFIPNSGSFTLAADVTRDIVVSLQSISYSGSSQLTLLDSPINIFIDSTDPFLWLPSRVCESFEDAFGLVFDETTSLYLVNESHHEALLASNAEVSFQLADVLDGGDAVTIILPYRAFDLVIEYPLVENSTYYFPLKRAANESQYTLGRTFLQESYLTVDYERGQFSISQCAWVEGAEQQIVSIQGKDSNSSSDSGRGPDSSSSSPHSTTTPGNSNSDKSLGSGAIAGIILGSLALISFSAVAWILLRRKKAASRVKGPKEHGPNAPEASWTSGSPGTPITSELSEDTLDTVKALQILGKIDGELSGESEVYQLDGTPKEPRRGKAAEFVQVYELPDATPRS